MLKRRLTQIITTAATNFYWQGFTRATIYRGPLKQFCHPGLHCYSCPSAVTACPLGALQNSLGSLREHVSARRLNLGLYVVGWIGLSGVVFGRFICGWLCPFGFLQDLLSKIPTLKFRLPRFTTKLKYVLLAVLVIAAPLATSFLHPGVAGEPWYCKAFCPAGTLEAGLPKLLFDPGIRDALGGWFRRKWIVLIAFLFLMVVVPRAFCRLGCPLGAIYGLFNRISFYRLRVERDKCTGCDACARACPMDVHVRTEANHSECIRCLKCVEACPSHAVIGGFVSNAGSKNRRLEGSLADPGRSHPA